MASAAQILLVDDEEELRELIAFELRDKAYVVTEASCGNDAIELLKAQPFDCVISDIRMPRGDGVQLLKWIGENLKPRPHVFLMTGFAEVTREEVLALGARDLLEKPFVVRNLLRDLAACLDSPRA